IVKNSKLGEDNGDKPMTYDEALKHFRTGRAIGDALRVTGSRVSQCRTAGGFSYPMQCVLEKESGGALVARREDDPAQALNDTAA
ncbi:hypothetical protein, partial [Pseudomonas umsongensis]